MAFDAFLQVDGIEGESTDKDHRGWIEIIDFGFLVRQRASAGASTAGGAGSERADFADFLIRKQIDRASPLLSVACAAGTHIDEIVVALHRSGGEKIRFMAYRMNNCIISKVKVYGGESYGFAFPAESVGVSFGSIQLCYTVQKRKGGGAAGNIAGGWNLQRNCGM